MLRADRISPILTFCCVSLGGLSAWNNVAVWRSGTNRPTHVESHSSSQLSSNQFQLEHPQHAIIAGHIASGNTHRLLELYSIDPEPFATHEQGSLLVGRSLLNAGRHGELQRLHNRWAGRVGKQVAWFVLAADSLIAQRQLVDARRLLEQRQFAGTDDAYRLLRLALITEEVDLGKTWDLLCEAYRVNPANSDVRSLRGQLLESAGESTKAELEYCAAHVIDKKNPFYRDQLAEFYRRRGNYRKAVTTWRGGLPQLPTDCWIKAWFWNRVTVNLEIPWQRLATPTGGDSGLLKLLINLPHNRFWDETQFQQLRAGQQQRVEREEVFWLRLLQDLLEGHDRRALGQLEAHLPQPKSYFRELEIRLLQVLRYRSDGYFAAPSLVADSGTEPHPFWRSLTAVEFHALQEPVGDDELVRIVQQGRGVAANLLAAGWAEAALQLRNRPPQRPPSELPEAAAGGSEPVWWKYGITQALRYNRSPQTAIRYATRHTETPAVAVLLGEMYLAQDPPRGVQLLQRFVNDDSAAGRRAAWLLNQHRQFTNLPCQENRPADQQPSASIASER